MEARVEATGCGARQAILEVRANAPLIRPKPTAAFTSEPLPNGKGFRVTFDQPGSYAYYCAIHPSVTGTVQVTA